MKSLVIVSMLLLSGCASMQQEYAFINSTPHELCAQPDVAARYGTNEECKTDMAARQMQTRYNIESRAQALQAVSRQYYQQQYSNTVHCTSSEFAGQIQTRCRQ